MRDTPPQVLPCLARLPRPRGEKGRWIWVRACPLGKHGWLTSSTGPQSPPESALTDLGGLFAGTPRACIPSSPMQFALRARRASLLRTQDRLFPLLGASEGIGCYFPPREPPSLGLGLPCGSPPCSQRLAWGGIISLSNHHEGPRLLLPTKVAHRGVIIL
jgi:hypothetical protein